MIEGTGRCIDHPLKTLSLEEQIAKGPRFESSNCIGICICDPGNIVDLDKVTKLCRFCWRVWRFVQAASPTQISTPDLHPSDRRNLKILPPS